MTGRWCKIPSKQREKYYRKQFNKKFKMRRWQLNQLIRKHGGNCALCGDPVNLVRNHEKQATRDHVIPLSKGGADHIGNMQLACSICNNRKADSLPQLS